MGISATTRQAAQYLRDCHQQGKIVTADALADRLNVTPHRARSIFQSAAKFVQSEYGLLFDNERGVGWRPIAQNSVAKICTQKSQRTIGGATDRWRDQLRTVNILNLNDRERTEYYSSVTKLHIQLSINDRETQRLIEEKASRNIHRGGLSTEYYSKRMREALRGTNFG